MKMTDRDRAGLVGRVEQVLAGLSLAGVVPDQVAAPPGLERRARLALRIALLRRGGAVTPVKMAETPVPLPVAPEPAPLPPQVLAETPPPAPQRQKLARVSMSTLRLEDAAMLLAAAAAPSEPQPAPQPFVERPLAVPEADALPAAMPRPRRSAGGVRDMGDAFAALSALGDAPPETAPTPDPVSVEVPQAAKPDTAPAKPRRRSGSVSAADGMANAAAALAAMQAADQTDAPAVKPASATEAAMAAGFAALGDAD
jgi:hypothetical protein